MHIFVLASYAPSLLNFRGPLLRELLAEGHRVSVAAPQIDPQLRQRMESFGISVFEVPLERTGLGIVADLMFYRAVRHLMNKLRPDRLLTYTIKPNIWGAFAAYSAGVPSVAMVTGLGYVFTETDVRPSLRERAARLIARKLYRVTTARNRSVIFQNPDDRRDFINAGCLADPSKARLVHGSGVDLDHYARAPLPGQPVFLMIARLVSAKGVRDYARAALELRRQRSAARFQLAGPLDGGPDSIAVSELDGWIASGLEYLGPLDDVRPAIAGAQVFVLPSYREGTPRAVLEAMAMGRAIITTDTPGCRETITHGSEGLLVPPRDPWALAAAMIHLAGSIELSAAMGERAFERARMKYEVHAVNRAVIDILMG
ncbi:glycosyltransferase family 4 protein [Ancylobacter sp. TS-1]|uniref:glycosyltransferase family 4 protein n=1 Tax=Ancylobacter sp. TS-1 TaxID=1850374 RepID=UPI001265C4DF|nr:glycosyltransferase family 4 protein [Ancylobacter sp. TS-1]QFR33440.1 glycosyltransferase [Ancylobacter sp. TS-1]